MPTSPAPSLGGVLAVALALRAVLAIATVWPDAYAFLLVTTRTIANPGVGYASHNIYPPAWFAATFPFLSPLAFLLGLPGLMNHVPGAVALMTRAPDLSLPLIPTPLASLGLKAPWMVADIMVALVLSRIVQDFADQKAARRAAILWLMNPLVVVNSSVIGQYDSAVGLFALLALSTALNGLFTASGIALGLSLMLKPTGWIMGLLLMGLVVFQLAPAQSHSAREAPRRLPTGRAGAVGQLGIGLLFSVVPLLLAHRLLGVGTELRARLAFPSLGGINLWLVELLPVQILQTMWTWAHLHFASVQIGGIVTALAAATFFVTGVFRRFSADLRPISYAAGVILLLLSLLTAPLAQPHYFVVAYPFLIIAVICKLAPALPFHALSLALVGYVLSVWGPAFTVLPLAVNFDLLSAAWLIDVTVRILDTPGFMNTTLLRDLRLLFGLVSLVSAVWLMVSCGLSIWTSTAAGGRLFRRTSPGSHTLWVREGRSYPSQ